MTLRNLSNQFDSPGASEPARQAHAPMVWRELFVLVLIVSHTNGIQGASDVQGCGRICVSLSALLCTALPLSVCHGQKQTNNSNFDLVVITPTDRI